MSAIWFQKTEFSRLVGDSVAIDAELSMGKLPRVAAATLPGSGPVHARFKFETAQKGIVLADGELCGGLRLRCQRCLDGMAVEIDGSLRLALSVREMESELIPDGYESLTIPDGQVRVVDLIEDEILLMLPIAAKHTNDECGPLNESLKALQGSAIEEKATPFADLAEMMRGGTD